MVCYGCPQENLIKGTYHYNPNPLLATLSLLETHNAHSDTLTAAFHSHNLASFLGGDPKKHQKQVQVVLEPPPLSPASAWHGHVFGAWPEDLPHLNTGSTKSIGVAVTSYELGRCSFSKPPSSGAGVRPSQFSSPESKTLLANWLQRRVEEPGNRRLLVHVHPCSK